MPSAPSSDQPPPSPPPRKKRRWWKVLLILLLLLGVAALWLNGPGARWLLARTLRAQLEKQGFSGEFSVEGRLWDGFALTNAGISGPDGNKIIRFDALGVDYKLADLLNKKIDRLYGKEIGIVLQAGPERPDKTRPDPEFEAIAETLRTSRRLVLPIELDFEEFSLRYERPDADPVSLVIGSLRHDAGSERFEILGVGSNALGDDGLPVQNIFIDWEEERLAMSPLAVFPEAAVDRLELKFPAGGTPQVAATFRAAESTLEAAVDDTGTLTAGLAGAPLELAPLLDRFAPRVQVGGALEALQIEVQNLLDPPAAWTGQVEVKFAGGTWKGGTIPAIEGSATVADQIAIDLRTAAGVHLTARSRDDQFAARRPGTWFKSLPVTFELAVASVHAALKEGVAAAGKEGPDLAAIPEAVVTAQGTLTIGGPRGVSDVAADWTTRGMTYRSDPVPDLNGTIALNDDVVNSTATLAAPRPEERLDLTVQFNLAGKAYEGSASLALPDPSWLNPLIPGDDPLWRPTGPLALAWSGSGLLPDATHRGSLEVDDLSLLAPEATIVDVKTKAAYQWPGTVKAESLSIRNGDLWLEGSTAWENGRVTIPVLRLHDKTGPLASLEGSAPLAADALSLQGFLKQDGAVNLKLSAKSLQLARLATLLPLPAMKGYEALFSGDLTVGGSPGTPTIGGQLRATGVRFPGPEKLPALAATLDMVTEKRQLRATGNVTEPGGKILDLQASLPLRFKEALEDPQLLKSLPLSAEATITDFGLPRLQILVPQLAEAEGVLNGKFTVAGPLGAPELGGGLSVTIKRYPLAGTPYREISDTTLILNLDGDRIVVPPSPLTIAGGKLVLSGTVSPFGADRALDLQLNANHALLWRDESMSMRANAALALKGPLGTPRLTGTIDLVESLYYKDIEIIPFGLPPASTPEPALPEIAKRKSGDVFDLPDAIASWPLEVRVRTADPFLIRGNLATGTITGNAVVTGTLANPRPDGEITITNATADLPFSTLEINRGIITLRPNAPLNPAFEIRGTSSVQSHLITLYLFGTLSDPKYSLVSSPPLPESEILTLLATGTTVGDLDDPELAKMRAFQLLLADLRLRAANPEANPALRALRPLFAAAGDLDLRVGDNDRFSGRQFNSATIELRDRWFLTFQVDAEGQSRGLIRYSVRARK